MLESLKDSLPKFFYAAAVFAIWLLALWLFKRILFRRLKVWASKTPQWWDDIFVDSLSFPLNFLIIASGLPILAETLQVSSKADRLAGMALQGTVIFCVVLFCDNLARGLMRARAARDSAFRTLSQGVIQGLVRGFIIGIGVLIFLDLIGISITPILASLGIGSLAVALALQETLSNFFAGIYVAVDRPVNVGDFVKLESGEEGYVSDIGWRSTRIRALSNHMLIIPNSKLIGSIITNYYEPDKEQAVLVDVGVHTSSDLNRVEKVTSEVAAEIMKRVPGGVPGFEPFIRYHSFGDSAIVFTVIMRAREFTDNYLIKHEFIKELQKRYGREGIVIPYPTRTLEISQVSLQGVKKTLF